MSKTESTDFSQFSHTLKKNSLGGGNTTGSKKGRVLMRCQITEGKLSRWDCVSPPLDLTAVRFLPSLDFDGGSLSYARPVPPLPPTCRLASCLLPWLVSLHNPFWVSPKPWAASHLHRRAPSIPFLFLLSREPPPSSSQAPQILRVSKTFNFPTPISSTTCSFPQSGGGSRHPPRQPRISLGLLGGLPHSHLQVPVIPPERPPLPGELLYLRAGLLPETVPNNPGTSHLAPPSLLRSH